MEFFGELFLTMILIVPIVRLFLVIFLVIAVIMEKKRKMYAAYIQNSPVKVSYEIDITCLIIYPNNTDIVLRGGALLSANSLIGLLR